MPFHAYSSIFKPIHAYSRQFQPIPSYSILFQPIRPYSTLFLPSQAYSSLVRPITAYYSLFQPSLANFSLFHPISTYSTLFKPITAYSTATAAQGEMRQRPGNNIFLVGVLVFSETKSFGVNINPSNKGPLGYIVITHMCGHRSSGHFATTQLFPLLCANMLPPWEQL